MNMFRQLGPYAIGASRARVERLADHKPRRLETHSSITNRKFQCLYIEDITTTVNSLSTCLMFNLTCLL